MSSHAHHSGGHHTTSNTGATDSFKLPYLSFRRRKAKCEGNDSDDRINNNDPADGTAPTMMQHQSEPSTSHQIIPTEPCSNVNNGRKSRKHCVAVNSANESIGSENGEHSTSIELKAIDKKMREKHTQCTAPAEGEKKQQHCGCIQIPIEHAEFIDAKRMAHDVSSLKSSLCVFLFSFIFTFVLLMLL